MMYRDGDNATSPATVLCPSYEIFSSETSFWCEYSLDKAFCGTRLYLMLGDDDIVVARTEFNRICFQKVGVKTECFNQALW